MIVGLVGERCCHGRSFLGCTFVICLLAFHLLILSQSHLITRKPADICVGFRVTIFHCSHWQTTALSKAFPSYVIPPCRAVPFVVVRHHRLGDDYWAAIVSTRLHCAVQVWRRILCGNS